MSIAVSIGEILAISNRDDLVSEVKAELDRSDITEDEIRSFIRRAEARFNRILRHPSMEAVTTLTASAETAALPSDFLAMRTVFSASRTALGGNSPADFIAYQGLDSIYCLMGGEIRFSPAPKSATTFTIVYYRRIPALTADSPTNWLLQNHPDVYFYATCLGAESRVGNDDRLILWKAALDEAMRELQRDGANSRFGGRLRLGSNIPKVRGA